MRRAAIAIAAALALAPSPARADDHWYGEQVLVVDAAAWGLIGAGFWTRTWQLAAVGAATNVLGGPLVHIAHENLARAGISFGLRTVGPVLGIAIGGALDRNDREELIPSGPLLGLALGWVAAQIVDIAVVASEDDPATAPRIISIGGHF